jgi:hypothetical protein
MNETLKNGINSTFTLAEVKAQLRASHEQMGTWRAVATKYGLPVRTIYKVAMNPKYYPKSQRILKALNLQQMISVPVCPIHGVAHLSKRCPIERKLSNWRDGEAWLQRLIAWFQ